MARRNHDYEIEDSRLKKCSKAKLGGADGIRTHDLLDAIEARSQLRHGPTGVNDSRDFTSGKWRRPSPTDYLDNSARNVAP
jgi:hypothetical protein